MIDLQVDRGGYATASPLPGFTGFCPGCLLCDEPGHLLVHLGERGGGPVDTLGYAVQRHG